MENNATSARPVALITGADGGMGTEITRAVALAGYKVLMASCRVQKAEALRRTLMHDHPELDLEVRRLDLASLASVDRLVGELRRDGTPIRLLMNCAGTMETGLHITEDGLERTVSVNYVGAWLLTNKLLPLMSAGSRVVNMVSCTYATRGRRGSFWRIPVYSNTKLALTLFTLDLAGRVRDRGIIVNCADPGIVSTDIITMHLWFDPLTDLFFRPFIRTPRQGADTAIRLLLDEDAGRRTGTFNVSGHAKPLSDKYTRHPQMKELWDRTEQLVRRWL